MPDGSSFSIRYAETQDAQQVLVRATSQIADQISDLKGRVMSVMQTIDGDAAQSYSEKHDSWMVKVNGMGETLNTGTTTLATSTDEYAQTDRSQGARWAAAGG
ncbi:WXG100 family type VII secretion target [Streptomyces sp. ADI93-02]|uniref:WXG100 family type VII secretion target n=1 Tax=Streptomyces sp. ADI93-02 TaxID=1522757 RepID=UPI000F54CF1D|nr:WXG100 family type VII secretion target [Streptomyces sp. ADI93-02]RPK33352.1 WXG domain conatining protein [Streptomyces sp. ADI93-02]